MFGRSIGERGGVPSHSSVAYADPVRYSLY